MNQYVAVRFVGADEAMARIEALADVFIAFSHKQLA
jgi:hypothetical protein